MGERFGPIGVTFPRRRPIRGRISRTIDRIVLWWRGPRTIEYTGAHSHNLSDPRNWNPTSKPRCGDTIVFFDLGKPDPTNDPHDPGDQHEGHR